MIDPTIVEGLTRGIAVGGLAATGGALALASRLEAKARWVGLAFCAAAIGHVLDNWNALRGTSVHASLPTWLLSALGPGLLWAFAMSLFDDRPADWRLVAIPAVLLGIALLTGMLPHETFAFIEAYNLLSAALVVHALFVVWRGWRGDLVERRRQLRAAVIVGAGLYVLAIALGNIDIGVRLPVEPTPLPQAVVLALLSIAGAVALLRADTRLLETVTIAKPQRAAPADRADLERLRIAVAQDEVWRDENLTIGGMAEKLGMPEHRLRRLINSELGYRNFAGFLNASRIAAAKVALSEPGRKTIASVAFDLGFGSLGPFNRAFKEATGVTPTAWRSGERTPPSPNPENPLRI
jgi:AraC-like DNA-binding protein